MLRVMAVVVVLSTSVMVPTESLAQGGHLAGGAGLSAGTGGRAPAMKVSAGFQSSPHIGFELELSVLPRLDFGTHEIGLNPVVGLDLPPSFPTTTIASTGRLTAVQVNVIVPITAGGKLRVSAVAGGGTAHVRTRVHLQRNAFTLPGISVPGFDLPGLTLPAEDITRSESATGLALNTGGLVEYPLNPKVGVGVDLRYWHTSASRNIDILRATGHVIWRF
jgi:hypothetical protein